MSINYVPADKLFSVDFYEEMCNSIWKTNLIFDKFFNIGYSWQETATGEAELIQILELSKTGKAIVVSGAFILITIALSIFIILWNQRKIKKMLRELAEAQQKQEPKEDKPAGEP